MAETERVSFVIAGQELVMMVKPEERDDVMEAAEMVREQISDFARRGAASIPKQAVMTAFHLAFDWVRLSHDPLFEKKVRTDLERRVDSLIQAVDQALEA